MKKKRPAPSRRPRSVELERADTRRLDLSKLKHDLSLNELASHAIKIRDHGHLAWPFGSIETLTPTRTVGRGRTNLTIIEPTIVQIDAVVPHARFDLRASTRRPAMQMHFEAAPYGITAPATYFMTFTVEVEGQAEFRIDGFMGAGGISNAGTRVLSGRTTVTLVFKDLPPGQQIFGFIEQQTGSTWIWYSVQVSYPPLVISA